jgi:hypothetical protein
MTSFEILHKQSEMLDLFLAMRQISCDINATVQQDEEPGDKLLELLEQRTRTMEQIDAVYEILEYELKELTKHPELATPSEIEEIKHQRDNIVNLIKDIMELDQKSLLEMNRVKKAIALKLQQSRNSSRAQKAYLQEDVYTEGWFIDKKE